MSQAVTTSSEETQPQTFAELVRAGADVATLAAYLDGLEPQARVNDVQSLPGKLMPALYERCEGSTLTLNDMVPEGTPAGQQVIFAGRNDLLMFRLFEKRFARTQEGAVIGYNEQTMRAFTGPGFFTVLPAGAEIVIDYTVLPEQTDSPEIWPAVKPNARGLSHFVYKDMQDYCRRVSRDVVIGHATKHGESIGHYFVLVRRPAEAVEGTDAAS